MYFFDGVVAVVVFIVETQKRVQLRTEAIQNREKEKKKERKKEK